MNFVKNFIIFIVLFVLSSTSHATHWPVFIAPDKNYLLQYGDIDVSGCPAGEGKLIPEKIINIQASLCKTFCPGNWYWVAKSDGQCHNIVEGFTLQGYEIDYSFDDAGNTDYSTITATYGEENSNSFILTILPGEHWQCFVMNEALHFLSCTNDI